MICPFMSRPVVINDDDIVDAFVECQEEKCPAWNKGYKWCNKLSVIA